MTKLLHTNPRYIDVREDDRIKIVLHASTSFIIISRRMVKITTSLTSVTILRSSAAATCWGAMMLTVKVVRVDHEISCDSIHCHSRENKLVRLLLHTVSRVFHGDMGKSF